MDYTLDKWLSDFSEKTAQTYFYALKRFKKELKIEDLGKYLANNPDALFDFKKFAKSLEGRPPKTIATYTGAVKIFFEDHDLALPSKTLRKLRRRKLIPRKARAR